MSHRSQVLVSSSIRPSAHLFARFVLSPLGLVLFAAEAFVIVALLFEQLDNVGLAVVDALKRGKVAKSERERPARDQVVKLQC